MKTKQKFNISMSLALATVLSLSVSGCGGSDESPAVIPTASTATDVTVERGKVYDATVTDSSTPAQVAPQKEKRNVYTFAKTPVYPIMVNGGWIDVNDDGVMDAKDTTLDVEMKSYSTNITPITTLIASGSSEKQRKEIAAEILKRVNASGVGQSTVIGASDLLKVPSQALRDVFVLANAIYKDMKENNASVPGPDAVMSQFSTIDSGFSTTANAKDIETKIMGDLVSNGIVSVVSAADITAFEKKILEAISKITTPTQTPTAGGTTLPNLSGYRNILIYKNISASAALSMTSAYTSQAGYVSKNVSSSTSCTDFGFSNPVISGNNKGYFKLNPVSTCSEIDYNGMAGFGGSSTTLTYYGN